MEQQDYSIEMIEKWASSGHLSNVMEMNRLHVAQRLEAAHRRSLGFNGDSAALLKEMNQLEREGYIRTHVAQATQLQPKRRRRNRYGARRDYHAG